MLSIIKKLIINNKMELEMNWELVEMQADNVNIYTANKTNMVKRRHIRFIYIYIILYMYTIHIYSIYTDANTLSGIYMNVQILYIQLW